MYRPAKPRWDYFALPVLYGDQLVGKADTRADPKGCGVLVVERPSTRSCRSPRP